MGKHTDKSVTGRKCHAGKEKTDRDNSISLVTFNDAKARGEMYLFLSSCYLSTPNKDLVRQIMDVDFLDDLSSLFSEKAVKYLRDYVSAVNPDNADVSLKQEFMDLFAVPTGRYVMPFEDVCRGKTAEDRQARGPLMGGSAIAVSKIYREAGTEINQACRELPTHIGVELSFMSVLCECEAEAIIAEETPAILSQGKREGAESMKLKYRKLQIRFLRDHLTEWFPLLCQSILANAKSNFYRGLASITEEFLLKDLSQLLKQPGSEKHGGH
jgi:TorA maturation chaperone TorD